MARIILICWTISHARSMQLVLQKSSFLPDETNAFIIGEINFTEADFKKPVCQAS